MFFAQGARRDHEGGAKGGARVSAQPEPPGSRTGRAGPVCSTPVAPSDARCPVCNYDLAGVGGRPGAYSGRPCGGLSRGSWFYLVVLAIVIATN